MGLESKPVVGPTRAPQPPEGGYYDACADVLSLLFWGFLIFGVPVCVLWPHAPVIQPKALAVICSGKMWQIVLALAETYPAGKPEPASYADWAAKCELIGTYARVFKCPGYTGGRSAYLFVPRGLQDHTCPVLLERVHHHPDKIGTDLIFFVRVHSADSKGAHVVWADGRAEFLAVQEAVDLERQLRAAGATILNQDGHPDSITTRDPTAPLVVTRFNRESLRGVPLCLAGVFFVLRDWRRRVLARRAAARLPSASSRP